MDLKKDLMTFIHRRKVSSKGGTKVGNVSMKDGDHGTIFGINRKIVIGTGILFFTVFALAFIFASDDGNKNKNTQPRQTKQEIADPKAKDTGKIPGDYADLINADKTVTAKKTGNTQIPTNTTNAANTTVAATVPQIPRTSSYSQPYTLPYMNNISTQQAQPAVQTSNDASSSKSESVKDKFKAAIAFALGNGSDVADKTTTTNNNAQSAATPSSVVYTTPNGNGLQAGTLIPVMLCSGINTDLGGQVVTQVEADIYDSAYGNALLIPAGSRLLGNYESGKASADGRISVTFTTLILPNGGSYSLSDSMVAVDGAGYAGIAGRVNNHTGRTLGAGALSTALAAVAGVAGGNTSSSNSTYSTGQLAAQGAMSNLLNSASSLFQKGMNTQATVTVEPGYEFNVYVTKGISFDPY